jgi:hypothetical protein
MRSSRFYQTKIQIIGTTSEAILFFSGYFLGKEMFLVAAGLLFLRLINKLLISELMYRRSKAVVREEVERGNDTASEQRPT